jgi:hypothetical protein
MKALSMAGTADLPGWVINLDAADLQLIRRFVLASGSLKALATEYEVSYPTIRLRVDALIERMKLLDLNTNDDALEARVRMLVAEGDIDPQLGKELLRLHRSSKGDK